MKQAKEIFLVLLTVLSLNVFGQTQNITFNKIYELVEKKNFFKAKATYDLKKNELTTIHQKVIEAVLDNAFNRLEPSNTKITQILQTQNNLPDSLMLTLYKVKEDNAIKLFDYKEAKNTIITIIGKYKYLLSDEDAEASENNLKIWSSLEYEPKQQVKINESICLKMEKDKAGLNTLKVSSGKNLADFIFDTGANLSTTSETTAKQLDMKIIPVDIEVGTITGEMVTAQLAICPLLKLGSIEFRNTVFLVVKDEGLTFPQINYRINGILGFPIIEALKEIQTTQDGYFIVPKEESTFEMKSNMAMDGLTPLVLINDKHFTFDTGADNTVLYSPYFIENYQEIQSKYAETSISFGGAAGVKEFMGYKIDFNFNFCGKAITLRNVSLLINKIEKNDKGVYGNIGQDLIRQFHKMTLNFNQMFMQFD